MCYTCNRKVSKLQVLKQIDPLEFPCYFLTVYLDTKFWSQKSFKNVESLLTDV